MSYARHCHSMPSARDCAVSFFPLSSHRPALHPRSSEVIRQVEQLRNRLPQEIDIEGNFLIIQIATGVALARSGDMAPEELLRSSEVALDSARRSNDDSIALF